MENLMAHNNNYPGREEEFDKLTSIEEEEQVEQV